MPEMGDDVGGTGKQPRPLLVHPPPRPAASFAARDCLEYMYTTARVAFIKNRFIRC